MSGNFVGFLKIYNNSKRKPESYWQSFERLGEMPIEILRKFEHLHTKIPMENCVFTNFRSHLPELLSFYAPLEHKGGWFGG